MSWVKVTDIAYGRLRSPDLDVTEKFLTRFRAASALGAHRDRALHARHRSRSPHPCHREGRRRSSSGFAYYAPSEDDLEAARQGCPAPRAVETIDEPGGGKRVRLSEPNGYQIEVVRGIERRSRRSRSKRHRSTPATTPTARAGELMRLPQGAVARQAHRPRRADDAEARARRSLVPRDARHHPLRRRLCRRQGQRDRLVQPLRPRRRLCRPPRVLLPAGTKRPASTMSRSRRTTSTTCCMGHEYLKSLRQVRAHVGHRPPPARQPGLRLLGRPVGPRARALGRQRSPQSRPTARNLVPAEEGFESQWGERPPEKFINHASP